MKVKGRAEVRFAHKRDGRLVVFDLDKLVRSLYEALKAAGSADARIAHEVGALAHLLLAKESQERPVSTRRISEVAAQVLVETGFKQAAEQFGYYCERRDFIRSQIEVRLRVRQLQLFEGDDVIGERTEGWKKARIYEDVVRRGCDISAAERIASRVEGRVIAAGLRSLSGALIRELIENELAEYEIEKKNLR